MRFGERTSFAVECLNDGGKGERFVFGRIRLWVGGARVGNFEERGSLLGYQAFRMQAMLERLADLEEPAFRHLSDRELFKMLSGAIDREVSKLGGPIEPGQHQYQRFDFLTESGWPFSGTTSFVSRENGSVRILGHQPEQGFTSARVPVPEFTSIVAAFLRWHEDEGREHAG